MFGRLLRRPVSSVTAAASVARFTAPVRLCRTPAPAASLAPNTRFGVAAASTARRLFSSAAAPSSGGSGGDTENGPLPSSAAGAAAARALRAQPVTTSHRGRFLEFVTRGKWEFVRRPNAGGVVTVVPVTSAGELLLVEQFRPPLNAVCLELPAGLVGDKDTASDKETLLAGAIRELGEETGYRTARPDLDFQLALSGPSSAGMSNEIITFFVARNLTKFEEVRGDGDEHITLRAVPLPEVERFLESEARRGVLIDYKIHTGLWLLARRGLLSVPPPKP